MSFHQRLNPDESTPTAQDRPEDKHYTAIDGHTYDNSPRYSRFTGEWYFSSAFARHADDCRCFTDPDFHG
ncbi:hypothetical protein [Arthrobacter sp. zg-Y1110]|uniref:hypothetical protein n=1 Tax=Arthrobacter sp. zg-Y1110 TaxID=2886932 RepID=UPI001D140669|nr:hypothetical protein [Arthrobacter sp. zg-Y1110]MCC3292598.1 hypothetical protein [Arthrobacter sp. zg-Y1110]UWX86971.1 hypothetical protein N2K99_16595 [Arthrobacter sp. zg-Y1110]